MNSNPYGSSITIEIVTGGFILTYPKVSENDVVDLCREVFTSPRKLNQKVKEVIDAVGLVSEK